MIIFRTLLDDFSYALSVFDDPDIRTVQECLQLSQDALTMDGNQLAYQLVARLYQVCLTSRTNISHIARMEQQ